MVIRKEHAVHLEKLLQDQEQQRPFTTIAEADLQVYQELESSGLVRQHNPLEFVLTTAGVEVATVLRELYERGPSVYSEDLEAEDCRIEEAYGLATPERWEDDWRWVGSEIIALLEAAAQAGQIGPSGVQPLLQRGLGAYVWDRKRKRRYYKLTAAGDLLLKIYYRTEPPLNIDARLADFIRSHPIGPADAAHLRVGSHEEHLLEGMRLIAYSVPDSSVYAFTGLGQAVKQALSLGGFGSGTVLSVDIMTTLVQYVDGKEIDDVALATLQELGYVGPEGEVLPAGEWALEAYRLWHSGSRTVVWSFAIEQPEVELLKVIQMLWQKAALNPEEVPTFDRIRAEMIDRKVKEYKELLARYGRKIKEMPRKYQKIAEQFQQAKDLARWYDSNFMLRAELHSLESFQLLQSQTDEAGKEVFAITSFGEKVLEDQHRRERSISSMAVKAITMTRKRFSAPGYEWWQQAKDEGLLGTAEPTVSGYFYAWLAERIERLPFLTKFGLQVFQSIPARGITLEEIYQQFSSYSREQVQWVLEKLEARHLIEILPDGNVVETEAGQLLDQALSGVPTGVGEPVTPLIIRLLRALRQVGTLYVKEQKVRVLPRNIKEAIRISGLAPDQFEKVLSVARAAGYVGQNTVNESGLLLLQAVEAMNPIPEEQLTGYVDLYEQLS